jgi:hypothetical protein
MKCPYCFADGVFGGLCETCSDLANCNNCTVDIALGGNWTGYGMADPDICEFIDSLPKKP